MTPVDSGADEDTEEDVREERKRGTAKRKYLSLPKNKNGVDLAQLRGVVEKLESTFLIIPNAKLE
eukprot:CAMPEP_0172546732 /NCGR_PEP_ID=MMETSP1067-20121228/16440_1 /TAXON_ID=265564 ORGANISM="Thalassiosira punctigera, Strain Tpunct2005C2" /NCGR_SAMPLE_ID=MMETSP1067 /ASSEMBLY_ACC=CAM_ASM_000444 /LENGTH=64 /DNA_ID=CAMNT_0013333701 /DNA_START=1 /DNA_END=192 /DNA_ORIENTATION=+